MTASAPDDQELARRLKDDPFYAHVCLCGVGKPAGDKGRAAKCCEVCAGCNQRIKRASIEGHTKTCVAYGQVTGRIPIDNSWWLADDWLRRRSFGQPHIARLHEGEQRRKRD